MSLKEQIINEIIEIEGGYINDPSDSGGETNYGITKKVAKEYGYSGEMKDLAKDLAFQIYSDKYWDSLKLDEISRISFRITKELADTGINMGVERAANFLQRCLNALNNNEDYYKDLLIDGIIGSRTLEALTMFVQIRKNEGMKILLNMLNCLQGEFYISLAERRKKDEKFIYGWFKNRITLN